MLLALDIGNTNTVAAVFDGDNIVCQIRIATDETRTGDEYTSILLTLLRDRRVEEGSLTRGIISSVVPVLTGPFVTVCRRLCGATPFVVTPALAYEGRLEIKLDSAYPRVEMGTDILCDAVAARALFGESAFIAVDFGTALTLTAADSRGFLRGVAIAPGLGTALRSLAASTAQLPIVPLEAPPSSLGMNTTGAIQAGVVLGYKSLVEGLIYRMKRDLEALTGDRRGDIKVVATGGLNSVLKPITDVFTLVDKNLTIRGLKIISDAVQ